MLERLPRENFSQTKGYKVRIEDITNKLAFNDALASLDFVDTDENVTDGPKTITYREEKGNCMYISRALQIPISQKTKTGRVLVATIYRVEPKPKRQQNGFIIN